ncbi:tyrosine-type recombinase/integrase [Ureibacillus thermophilus]|uniref:Site-specific integrase n=1 Tax=Ureibacillus thermophilus TaxID=367743 RepID=A0A4P6UR65_9BACL|nr:site-specific integrase [Ureibacillus thermophilus]QBK24965.1 site-specific integrase [Ureibacillus thermophilus]
MKLPNGYGSVFKLSGRRRRPWAVRVTTGWTDDGKQKYEYLGYYKTRPKAMMALAEYNKNPFDLSAGKITFKEVYERFKKERFPKMSKSSQSGYTMAYNRSKSLHDMKFIDIRKSHMQEVIDNCDKSHGTKRKIKILYNQLYKYAMENDLTHKDYARFVELPRNNTKSSRKPFTLDEINKLWEHVDRLDFIDTVLIMIYTGLRPGELVEIKNENIRLEERCFRGGFKTEAGTNRVIPIHKKILHLIEARMNPKHEYLVTNHEGNKMSYYVYYHERWKKIMEQLELDHRPHDCRHTFATLMDNAGANKLSIRRIMGHAGKDITDNVYTHKDIEQLLIAIDTLK